MNFRNYPPQHGVRVPADALRRLATAVLEHAGMDPHGAALVAKLLVECDCRCVYSHGTRLLAQYVPKLRLGTINPRPQPRIERDMGATAVVNGDGGLGYHACHLGMELAVARAQQFGVATVTTRQHDHFGAGGIWSRMALPHNCIGMAVSSHQTTPARDNIVVSAGGNSPMSIAIPAHEQPPVVLDMSARGLPLNDQLLTEFPFAYFKFLGIGMVTATLGGVLAGIWQTETNDVTWKVAQGSFLTVWSIAHFIDVPSFKLEMDRHIQRARDMQPVPGFGRSDLPGGREFEWERDSLHDGVAVSDEHCELLARLALDAGYDAAFASYEPTRFSTG